MESSAYRSSPRNTADLALAADMYMIPRLVKKACKRLVPTKPEEVFPAFTVISLVANTDLEPQVVKLVQFNTKEIMTSEKFLSLDIRCVEFILKQEKLSCAEVEVWKCLVKWAKHQVADDDSKKKTTRTVLGDTLKHVRFGTLTQDEIVKEVAPTNVFNGDELSSLLCAVIGNTPWNQPGLSSSETKRLSNPSDNLYAFVMVSKYCVSKSEEKKSYFTIETNKNIELQSFVFRPKRLTELSGSEFYSMKCSIKVRKEVNELYTHLCDIAVTKNVFGGDKRGFVSLLNSNNQFLKLEENNKYHFSVELTPAHMTYEPMWGCGEDMDTTLKPESAAPCAMNVQLESPFHIGRIWYKILP